MFPCNACDRSFSRSTHLTRHQRKHSTVAAFECQTCSKRFHRRDTLRRHEATHTIIDEPQESILLSSSGRSRIRACVECARARTRCSKGHPCLRCRQRSLSCNYAEARKGLNLESPDSPRRDDQSLLSGGASDSDTETQTSPSANTSIVSRISSATHDPSSTPRTEETQQGVSSGTNNDTRLDTYSEQQQLSNDQDFLDIAGCSEENRSTYQLNSNNWIDMDTNLSLDYHTVGGFGFVSEAFFAQSPSDHSVTTPYNALPRQDAHRETIPNEDRVNDGQTIDGPAEQTQGTITHPSQIKSIFHANLQDRYGALYADQNNGGRLAASARFGHRRQSILAPPDLVTSFGPKHRFPDVTNFSGNQIIGSSLNILSADTFSALENASLGLMHGKFPPINFCNQFIFMYFQHFHDSFPILHKASHDLNTSLVLSLAIMAIGSRYSRQGVLLTYVAPLQALYNSMLNQVIMSSQGVDLSLSSLQAILLHHLTVNYGQVEQVSPIPCFLDPILQRSIIATRNRNQPGNGETDWTTWIVQQSWLRLRQAIWLLDSMKQYQIAIQPLFDLNVANEPLIDETAWDAQSASDWSAIMERSKPQPSLSYIVRNLIETKTMHTNLGHFSQFLVIHGLHSELRNIIRNIAPSSAASDPHTWLPPIPWFQRWRNNACDCIDALHWVANGEIAKSRGLEPSIVLQLHFARLLLLVPYESIRILAVASTVLFSNAQDTIRLRRSCVVEQDVIRWAQQDHYKARLAVLHSAACWWHIQRFSIQAFYEPTIIFLTTLTLWAYVSYTPVSSTEPTENEADVSFIHLDRPCDDEVVQAWIQSGRPNSIRAFIGGIGDIFATDGPLKIVQKGICLLKQIATNWQCATTYILHLQSLTRFMQQKGLEGVQT